MWLRATAFCIGVFGLVGSIVNWLVGFDPNIWWIDVRFMPRLLADTVVLAGCGSLIAFALQVPTVRRVRLVLLIALAPLAIVSLANSVTFYKLIVRHRIQPLVPIPLSILVSAVAIAIIGSTASNRRSEKSVEWRRFAIAAAVFLVAFPLAQILFFGTTSYERKADVAVVFGAQVHADGSLSTALGDRVATACELYHRGSVHKLIFSGGPGEGATDEPHAMRAMAMDLGVPDEAIQLDVHGLTTAATVANTVPMFQESGARRVIVVSHFFHLPRIKLAYQRAGVDVYTVPSPQRRRVMSMTHMLVRETAAWWMYLVRPAHASTLPSLTRAF